MTSDDAQDPFLHDPQAFERMVEAMQHTYPSKYPPGTHWAVDAAWEILDTIKPGIISDDVRAFLAGQIANRLMKERGSALLDRATLIHDLARGIQTAHAAWVAMGAPGSWEGDAQ